MDHDEFVGEVQNRLELPSRGDALQAIRAVLTSLGERLQAGEALDLAAPLPEEIGRFLEEADPGQRFPLDAFYGRVQEQIGTIERSEAAFYTKAIIDVLDDAVPGGEMNDIRANLPDDYDDMFEILDQDEEPVEAAQRDNDD